MLWKNSGGFCTLQKNSEVRFFLTIALTFFIHAWLCGQQVLPEKDQHGHNHHDCAHTKTISARSGTYPQNPLLWHYDVHYYALDVLVDPAIAFISGSARVAAMVTHGPLQTFVLELMNNMQVDSVLMSGQHLTFSHAGNELLIVLPAIFEKDDEIDLRVFYQGVPQASGFFSGFQIGTTPYGKPVLWTLSEPLNARQWWPVKQVLEDKADSVTIKITTPKQYMAGSNGLLVDVFQPEESTKTYIWKSHYPIAYYLISLAVSEYAEYSFFAPLSKESNQVFVQNFIYDNPAYLTSQKANIDRTADFMRVFSQLFGDYPFAGEKYGHVTAPMGGGMEHQTMSTMSGFSYDLVSHELAHQWFGNSVTCATWSDIWINEGFASYGEYLAREFLQGQASAQTWLNNAHNSVLSALDGSVYVPPLETANVWRIFNGRLSYRKGAAILHMLRKEINDDDVFFEVLHDFRQEFADSVATGDDFRKVADRISGRSWEFFFDQWYYGEGHPLFEIFWWMRNDSLYVRSVQQGSADYPAFFKTSLDFRLTTTGKPIDVRFFQSQPDQTFSVFVGMPLLGVVFDPELWLLKKASLKKEVTADWGRLVKAYPNPFGNKFSIYIEDFAPAGTYRLWSPDGKIIMQGTITQRITEIEPGSGIGGNFYLLEVITEERGQRTWVKLLRMD